jgi:PAS domain S-box-containing protein
LGIGDTPARDLAGAAAPADDGAARAADALACEFASGALAEELRDFPLLAASLCEAPMAAFSLVGMQRQHLVARVGIDAADTPREVAFCTHTLDSAEGFEVHDATADPRFAANPLVTGAPRIGAYAGVAIEDDAGRKVGSLFVAWHAPRRLSASAMDGLRRLARQLARRVQLHVAIAESARSRDAARASDRRFRRALEALDHVAVQAYRRDGRITFWNRASESLYGWRAEEAVGADIVPLLFAPQEHAAERELLARVAASGDVPAAGEVDVKRRDGSTATIYAARVLVPSADGEPEFFCFDVDVTARRAAEAEALAGQQLLRDLADTVHGAIQRYVVRADGTDAIEYCSAGARAIWEIDAQAIIDDPRRLWAMVHPDDVDAMRASVDASARDLAPWRHQWRIRTPSGAEKVLSGAGTPRRGPQGETVWITHFTDVTERVAAERALALSEERLRAIADSIPGAIFRYIVHPDGRDNIEYMSRGCEEIWEIDAASIMADPAPLWAMVLPDDLPAMRDSVLDSARTLAPWRHQWRMRTPSGKLKWLAGNGNPVRTAAGDVVWSSFIIDRTAQATAEAALARSEARFRAIADNIPGAIFRYALHADGRHAVEFISQGAQAIWEHAPAAIEADAQLLFQCIAPEERAAMRESLEASARAQGVWQHRWRITTPSGRRKWLQASGQPFRREDGGTGWDGYLFDVTERRESEAALALSEARLRVLMESAPDAIVVLDLDAGCFTDFNGRACRMFGVDEARLRELGPAAVSPELQPDGRSSTVAASEFLRRAAAGEEPVFEWTHQRADGTPVPCEVHLVRIPDANRTLIRGSLVDITARKDAEEALRRTEARLSLLVKHMADGFFTLDREFRYVDVNDATATYVGVEPAQLRGRRLEDLFPGAMDTPFGHAYAAVMAGGESCTIEDHYPPLDRWYEARVLPAPTGVAVFFRDVTERKRAEQALRDSEARIRLVVQNMLDGFFVLDRDWRFVEINAAAARAMRQPAAALVGRNLRDVFPGVEQRVFGKAYVEVLAGGPPTIVSDFHPLLRRWYEARVQPSEAGVAVFFNDVTERREAENALRESERRFRSLVEDLGTIAVQGYDDERRITFWNRASEQFYGWTAAEAMGRRLEETIIPPPMREAVVDIHARWVREGRVDTPSEELVLVDRAGLPVPVYSSHIMLRRPDGGHDLYCLDVDLRDLRRTEAALQEANAALRQRNEELQQFVMIASHDLQEPLRKVQTFADRLQGSLAERLGTTERDYLDRLHGAASRMRELIQDLLDYSAVSFGAPQRAPVDLAAVLRGVLDDLAEPIAASGARVDAQDLPTIEADPVQMRQLLQNLLGNALKYRDPRRAPRVRVEAAPVVAPGGPGIALRVADNGIGFDDAHRERIFAPFQRLHARTEYDGTGIGLAIVRRIVERHGGSVEAQGRPGEGATFTIVLPMGDAAHGQA